MSDKTVSIASNSFKILSLLGDQKTPLSMRQIKVFIPEFNEVTARAGVVGLIIRKAIVMDSVKDGEKVYAITPAGRAILKLPSNELLITEPKKGTHRSKEGKVKTTAPTPIGSAAPTLNLSISANSAADAISQVIRENHNYRELLKQVTGQLAGALGLQIIDPTQQGS